MLDLAVAVAATDGLDAVTIRRLAADLDVTPMALYWHFRTKDDLLAALGDRILDAVKPPEPTGDWPTDLRNAMSTAVAAMRPHPQLAALVAPRLLVHPHGLALSEAVLDCLARAGFDHTEAAYLSRHALRIALATVADIVDPVTGTAKTTESARPERDTLAALPPDSFPQLQAHADALAYCLGSDASTTLAIDLFVAGVRELSAGGANPTDPRTEAEEGGGDKGDSDEGGGGRQ